MKSKRAIQAWAVIPLLIAGLAGQTRPPASRLININAATVEELESLPAIGEARAQMIVRIRERNGPFKSVEELRALPRLSEKQFQALRKLVTAKENTTEQSPR